MSTFIGIRLRPGDDVQHCQLIVSFQKLYILQIVHVKIALVSGDEQCALIGADINRSFQLAPKLLLTAKHLQENIQARGISVKYIITDNHY